MTEKEFEKLKKKPNIKITTSTKNLLSTPVCAMTYKDVFELCDTFAEFENAINKIENESGYYRDLIEERIFE